jgi:putative inorganic carbon (HCO3(-)) transporter
VVGRLELWGAALRLIETRPLLGVGPDNFRHLYGAQLGLETWDERVQANNLYLELLADTGLLGLAAFLWLILAPLAEAVRAMRAPPIRTPTSYWLLGCCLGVLAFLVHGLLDSFLAFTPTALLFWMLLAMIPGLTAQKPQVSGR